jgi:glycosyltransferase 2 family protein
MIMKNLKKIIIVLISFVAIYSILLSLADVSQIFDSLINIKLELLPLIFGLVTFGWIILFIRWQILLKSNKIEIPLKSSFVIYISGFALQFIPGEIGEFLKVELLKNKFNISRSKSSPIVLVEMFYNATGLVALSIAGIWFFEFAIYIFGIFSFLLILFFYLINRKKYFLKILNNLIKIKFFKKYAESFSESVDVLQTTTKKKVLFYSISLSTLFWFVECIAIYLLLLSFGIFTVDLLTLLPMYSSSIILGVISFLPLGLGVFEGSLAGFLNLNGVNITISLAVVILSRIITRWYSIIVGLIVLKITHGLTSNSKDSTTV